MLHFDERFRDDEERFCRPFRADVLHGDGLASDSGGAIDNFRIWKTRTLDLVSWCGEERTL